MKMINETRKILNEPNALINTTTVRNEKEQLNENRFTFAVQIRFSHIKSL